MSASSDKPLPETNGERQRRRWWLPLPAIVVGLLVFFALWAWHPPEPRETIDTPADVRGLSKGPPGGELLAAMGLGSVQVWQTRTQVSVATLPLPSGGSDQMWPLTFSPDGKLLATCHRNRSRHNCVTIWDVRSGSVVLSIHSQNIVDSDMIAFAAHGKQVAVLTTPVGSPVGTYVLELYDLEDRERVKLFEEPKQFCCGPVFTPDGRYVLLGCYSKSSVDGTILVWDVATGEQVSQLNTPDRLWGLMIAPNGWNLIVYEASRGIVLIDRESGKRLGQPWKAGKSLAIVRLWPVPHTHMVVTQEHLIRPWYSHLPIIRDWLATYFSTHSVAVRDVRNGRVLARFPASHFVAFTDDHRAVLTQRCFGTLQYWDLPPPRPWWTIVTYSLVAGVLTYLTISFAGWLWRHGE